MQSAKRIIAQVNPLMPRTHGDSFVHLRDFDAYVELESVIPEHLPAEQDPITAQIGRHVASLIRDGDCLQMGIGAIPDATLACLGDRQNLGIHTEMFSDGVLPLLEKGCFHYQSQ